jgi:hypothetical protein
MAIQEFGSPFSFRRGGVAKSVVAKRGEATKSAVIGNADRPGLDLPPCYPDEAHEAAKALDELCARRPLRPPGKR